MIKAMTRKIDISHKTIIFIAVFLVLLWTLYLILDILLLLFVAFILMSALAPLVDRLSKWHFPRPLAIFVVFIVVVGGLISLIGIGLRPLISQTTTLGQQLPQTLDYFTKLNLVDRSVVNEELTSLSRQLLSFTLHAFENIVGFVSVIVITFYLLLDKEKFETYLSSLFINRKDKVRHLLMRIEEKLGAWLRGQLVLSFTVGGLIYVSLTILGIDSALPLGILAGLLEVVPVIGPIISSIPGILLALTISPVTATIVAGVYLAVQQMESHIIVPQVMKKAVGLNPLLVILAVSIGGRLLGFGGALLAVPLAVVIQLIGEEVLTKDWL